MNTHKLLQISVRAILLTLLLATGPLRLGAGDLPYAWGFGLQGQLGNNAAANSLLPVPVTSTGVLAGKTVTALAGSYDHSIALCSDGTVATWGANQSGQSGSGQPGGNFAPLNLVPVAVNTTAGTSALFGKTVTAIAAGNQFCLALCSDGTVAAWGINQGGQLGDGTTTERDTPAAVDISGVLAGKSVKAIAAGVDHGMALCTDGTLVAWGANDYGQLGNNSTTGSLVPVVVNMAAGTSALFGKTVTAIAAGGGDLARPFSLALCSDGTVVAWGYNGYGSLGDNTGVDSSVPVAVNTAAGTSALFGKTVVAISAGQNHSLALCSDGTIAAWGLNQFGQVGDNSINTKIVPVLVNPAGTPLAGKTVTSIAAGALHSLALCADGTLAAWGCNFNGAIGNNTTTHSHVPTAVNTSTLPTGAVFTRIFGGSFALHTLALVNDCAPALLSIANYAGVTISGTIGCTYRIDYTTNLNNPMWIPLVTNTLLSSPILFVDTNAISGSRYYRTVTQ